MTTTHKATIKCTCCLCFGYVLVIKKRTIKLRRKKFMFLNWRRCDHPKSDRRSRISHTTPESCPLVIRKAGKQ